MCWTGKNIPRVAKEDIKVIKAVYYDKFDDIITSAYYGFQYKIGSTYSNKALGPLNMHDSPIVIFKGFHSYNPTKVKFVKNVYVLEINEENDRLDHFFAGFMRKLNCTIPKGAIYYENEFGEIVSNQLRIDSIEELKE